MGTQSSKTSPEEAEESVVNDIVQEMPTGVIQVRRDWHPSDAEAAGAEDSGKQQPTSGNDVHSGAEWEETGTPFVFLPTLPLKQTVAHTDTTHAWTQGLPQKHLLAHPTENHPARGHQLFIIQHGLR